MLPRPQQIQLALVALVVIGGVAVLWTLAGETAVVAADAALALHAEEPARKAVEVEVSPVVVVSREQTSPDVEANDEDERPAAAAADPKDSPRIPGVEGRVTDVFGFPLAEVRVTARVRRAQLAIDLGTALTDSDGRYAIAFPSQRREHDFDRALRSHSLMRPGIAELGYGERVRTEPGRGRRASPDALPRRALDAPLELIVIAFGPGYGPGIDKREVEVLLPDFVTVDFQIEPGNLLCGDVQLEHPLGRYGVPGAQVFLRDELGTIAESTGSEEGGAWKVYFDRPGRYDVFARHEGWGTGILRRVDIGSQTLLIVPPVFLRGLGRLNARVRYPDGSVAQALKIEARHVLIASKAEGGLTEAERIALEIDEGLVIGGGTTDAYGEIGFRGLRPGEFELRYCEEQDPSLQPAGSWACGDAKHELVYGGRRLRVSVTQAAASPADPAQIAVWKLSLDEEARPVEKLKGRWSDAGEWFAVVGPGERYLVKAWASNQQFDWMVVDILPASYETLASLALFGNFDQARTGGAADASSAGGAKSRWAGRLQLAVSDDAGRKLDGWRATVLASDGTIPRGWSGAAPDEKGELPALPPGAYTLEVAPESESSMLLLLPQPRPFVIRAGQTLREDVRGELGGRIRLKTMADASLTSAVELDELGADDDDPRDLQRARGWVRAKSAPPAERRKLSFRADPGRGGKSAEEWIELGLEAVCDPLLAAGRYVVTVETASGETRDYEVEVERGKVREIDFVARPLVRENKRGAPIPRRPEWK